MSAAVVVVLVPASSEEDMFLLLVVWSLMVLALALPMKADAEVVR